MKVKWSRYSKTVLVSYEREMCKTFSETHLWMTASYRVCFPTETARVTGNRSRMVKFIENLEIWWIGMHLHLELLKMVHTRVWMSFCLYGAPTHCLSPDLYSSWLSCFLVFSSRFTRIFPPAHVFLDSLIWFHRGCLPTETAATLL